MYHGKPPRFAPSAACASERSAPYLPTELIGVGTDSEKAIRWLIALIVLCCDPLAIALTAAALARRSTTA
jgi:hypothetical protein